MTRPPYNSTISQSEADVNRQSEDAFEQRAFVSMKGELVGEYLDADLFEGTGENASAHGWENYLLKDRKTNKVRYFDRWNRRRYYFDKKKSRCNLLLIQKETP